jgi:geranylgeranyl reductase family protein
MKSDILVVGGGPAGATLARRLAIGGRDVILIDRATFPRHKSCGGGLSRHTIRALDLDFSSVVETEINRLVVDGAWTGRFYIELYAENTCQVVNRWDFDAFLVKQAVLDGVRLLENYSLHNVVRKNGGFEVMTSGETIQSKIICACDGALSKTGRALGFPKNQNMTIALEAQAMLEPDCNPTIRQEALFNFACIPMGYGWIFPRQSSLAIGVSSAQALSSKLLQNYFKNFINHCKELRDLKIHHIKGGQLPTFRTARTIYAERDAYLVGDAAGFVDRFTGEGIHFAVKSGKLAAEAILGGGPVQYENAVRHEIIPELELAAKWASLVFPLPLRLFGGIMSTPIYRHYLKYFVDIFIGISTYREMLDEKKWTAKMLERYKDNS